MQGRELRQWGRIQAISPFCKSRPSRPSHSLLTHPTCSIPPARAPGHLQRGSPTSSREGAAFVSGPRWVPKCGPTPSPQRRSEVRGST